MFRLALPCLVCLCLSGCVHPPPAVLALPPDAAPPTRALAEAKDAMDGLAPAARTTAAVPAMVGRGYSQIASQPGKTLNERRLLAIRAARMEAMRDLAEQVHGVRLGGQSTLRDAVMRDDTLAARVDGTLYGARTRAVRPLGADGYEVELEIDRDTLGYIARMAGRRG